jgi:hypothetical protein
MNTYLPNKITISLLERPLSYQLESRVMLDAAALATGAEAVADAEAVKIAEAALDSHDSGDHVVTNLIDAVRPQSGKTVLVVDSGVDSISELVAGVSNDVEIIYVDAQRSGLVQVAESLVGRNDISSLHIVSHGDAGVLHLGEGIVNFASLTTIEQQALKSIKDTLAENADILVYGCNFGAGLRGHNAVDILAQLTDADVAASDDITGSPILGADWDFEIMKGVVDVNNVVFDAFTQSHYSEIFTATFGGQNVVTTSFTGPYSVATADFDGDGDIDLVVGEQNGGDLVWFENDGNQTYSEILIASGGRVALGATNARYYEVVTEDLDGDGDMDIISSNYFSGTTIGGTGFAQTMWHENDGAGNFVTHNLDPIAAFCLNSKTQVVDVDSDGDLDILAINQQSDRDIYWYENDGAENFTRKILFNLPLFNEADVYAEDMDGDGDVDMVVGYGTGFGAGDTISWLENDGAQNYTEHLLTLPTAILRVPDIKVSDMDGDGDFDIIALGHNSDNLIWYENDGSHNYTEHLIDASINGARELRVADMDYDGDMDVLATSLNGNAVYYYDNDGSQTFLRQTITTSTSGAYYVNVADLDNDGDLDVLSTSLADNKVAWYENLTPLPIDMNGEDRFVLHNTVGGAKVQDIIMVDLDATVDGLDILVGTGTGFYAYVNNGDETFNVVTIDTSITKIFSVTGRDTDGDGDVDIVAAADNVSGEVYSYVYTPAADGSYGGFAAATVQQAAGTVPLTRPNGLGVDSAGNIIGADWSQGVVYDYGSDTTQWDGGDASDGGIVELITPGQVEGGSSANDWVALDNPGNVIINGVNIGNFGEGYAYDIEAGDLDGDGGLELVAVDQYGNIGVFDNGALAFTIDATTFDTPLAVLRGVGIGDADGDGDQDIIVADYLGNYTWLMNNSSAAMTAGKFAVSTTTQYNESGVVMANLKDVDAADIDGDGDADAIFADKTGVYWVESVFTVNHYETSIGGAEAHLGDDLANVVIADDVNTEGATGIVETSKFDIALVSTTGIAGEDQLVLGNTTVTLNNVGSVGTELFGTTTVKWEVTSSHVLTLSNDTGGNLDMDTIRLILQDVRYVNAGANTEGERVFALGNMWATSTIDVI